MLNTSIPESFIVLKTIKCNSSNQGYASYSSPLILYKGEVYRRYYSRDITSSFTCIHNDKNVLLYNLFLLHCISNRTIIILTY